MVVMYVVCGIVLARSGNELPRGVFYSLYGLSFFFCNMGPNTTTFVIPSEIFPTSIRASAHGVSAAAGKVGAAIGTALMPVILAASSLQAVMFASAAIAAAGLLFTLALTRESQHTDIMSQTTQQQQQLQTAQADTSTEHTQRAGALSSRKAALQSLSLSRAIRKARGYTDLLKQQSTMEEEDDPVHTDIDLGADDDEDMEDEHRMDGVDSDEQPHQEERSKRQEQTSEPQSAPASKKTTRDELNASPTQMSEVELTSPV